MKKVKSCGDLWDDTKMSTYMSLESQMERRKRMGQKNNAWRNNYQKFPKFVLKNLNWCIQESQQTPNRINIKKTAHEPIIVTLLETKEKEKIPKVTRVTKSIYRGWQYEWWMISHQKSWMPQGSRTTFFYMLKEKNNLRILYLEKSTFN